LQTELPEMKQIWDLTLDDFERHPVWVGVHTMDLGKPWHRLSDQATFRPWTESLPFQPEMGFAIVLAELRLHDGSVYPGFVRPTSEDWDVPPTRVLKDGTKIRPPKFSARQAGSPLAILGIQQPAIFVHGRIFGFWGGWMGIPEEKRQAFYDSIGKTPEDIFPIQFSADLKYATGIGTGQLDGFYRFGAGLPPIVEL
jgi:hypothetical protein